MVAVAGLDRHQERLSQDEGGLVEGGGRPLTRAFTPSLSTREPVFFNRASKTTVNEILKREILARKKASSASCRTILFCCYPDSSDRRCRRREAVCYGPRPAGGIGYVAPGRDETLPEQRCLPEVRSGLPAVQRATQPDEFHPGRKDPTLVVVALLAGPRRRIDLARLLVYPPSTRTGAVVD